MVIQTRGRKNDGAGGITQEILTILAMIYDAFLCTLTGMGRMRKTETNENNTHRTDHTSRDLFAAEGLCTADP